MMQVSVKSVPEAWVETLRQRAVRNHRSLQGELMAILERAVVETLAAQQQPDLIAASLGLASAHVSAGAAAAAREQPGADASQQAPVAAVDRHGWPIVRQGSKSVAQAAAELRAKFAQAVDSGPSSVDLIREDRDAR